MDEYLLENWMQNNLSDDEGFYNCPCCGYALDLINTSENDDYEIDYVYCWNHCLYTPEELREFIDAKSAKKEI